MVLEVWFADKDGQECYEDNWMLVQVKYCPFCGLESQPERSKRENPDMGCGALNSMET